MRFLSFLLISLFSLIASIPTWAISDSDLNVRNVNITTTNATNPLLESFIAPIQGFFFAPGDGGATGVSNIFITIAFGIKNFFIGIAAVFLMIGVIKLLFSPSDEEKVKRWRNNIVWITVGIFVMQISFGIWNTVLLRENTAVIGTMAGWQLWVNVFSPIVSLLQLLAGLGFLAMMVYAFFIIVTGGGDDEKLKKGKNIVIYAVIGFLLIRIPRAFVSAIYGSPDCKETDFLWTSSCAIKNQNLSGGIGIIGNIINYINTFLSVICVLLIIYAGWLVLISGGDEEKLKKAKNIILYIIIGLIILFASHAIFRFFILKG